MSDTETGLGPTVDLLDGEILEDFVPMKEESKEYKNFLALFVAEKIVLDDSLLLQDQMFYRELVAEESVDVFEWYNREALKFADFANQVLDVYGMGIWEVNYSPKLSDDEKRRGVTKDKSKYYQVRILALDSSGPVLIKSSSPSLLIHVFRACQKYGWFMFREGPIKYKFIWRGTGSPHILQNQSISLGK